MRLTLIDLLRDRAAAQPDDRAYTYLEDGETEGARLTWSNLDKNSRAIAAAIQARTRRGDRVLILLPPGIGFVPAFFGVVYAGAVAIPMYPPAGARADRVVARLRGMIPDADVALVVSTRAIHARAANLQAHVPELTRIPWLEIDDVDDEAVESWRPPSVAADALALLQYTSGSTSAPRGVMVSHANLLHNLEVSAALAQHRRDSVSVSWLPVNHDMGLIDGVLQPAFSGFPAYLMAPSAFLQRPARWLQAVSRYGATHSGGPNFAYDLCARQIADAERDTLDLSAWRIAFNGAEPVRRSTLERFHQRFAPCGFRWDAFKPAYGLAESTLLVTSSGPGEPPVFFDTDSGTSLVGSGRITDSTRVRIVNPATRLPVQNGSIGEIWVAGRSVALGYWNKPTETAATFHAFIDDREGPYLRTGDLGCIVHGRLFVTGRIKDLLIVRGVKHYPQDLEATAEGADDIIRPGGCAAVTVDDHGEERVGMAVEIASRRTLTHVEVESAVRRIRAAVSEAHQVGVARIYFVKAGALPRTTSGKLQRFLCRDWLLSGELDIAASWSERGVAIAGPAYPDAEAVA